MAVIDYIKRTKQNETEDLSASTSLILILFTFCIAKSKTFELPYNLSLQKLTIWPSSWKIAATGHINNEKPIFVSFCMSDFHFVWLMV